jgi:hypothetical protein
MYMLSLALWPVRVSVGSPKFRAAPLVVPQDYDIWPIVVETEQL